jgi:hypothetical protein
MHPHKTFAQQVYERAGYSEDHAHQLSNLFSVVRKINNRLITEGKPDLLTQLREKRARNAAI